MRSSDEQSEAKEGEPEVFSGLVEKPKEPKTVQGDVAEHCVTAVVGPLMVLLALLGNMAANQVLTGGVGTDDREFRGPEITSHKAEEEVKDVFRNLRRR